MTNFLKSFQKASRSMAPALITPEQLAVATQVTGINRYGLQGFQQLQLAIPENTELFREGFLNNHYVWTVTDWKARQFAKAKPIVYDVRDKSLFRKYNDLEPYRRKDAYSLRQKALEEISDPLDQMVYTLNNPNSQQTRAEFMYAVSVYLDNGNALIWGVGPDDGTNAGQFHELYLLPTSMYAGFNPSANGYEAYLPSNNIGKRVEGRDVIHLRTFNPDLEMQGNALWGLSKLTAGRRLLAKSKAIIEAEGEVMENRGSRTIIFPKYHEGMDDIDPDQAVLAGAEMRRKLKQTGSGGIATNSIELGAIQLGVSPKDYDFLASNTSAKEEICAMWHVDAIAVFSAVSQASRANAETAVKSSLSVGVLPDLELFAAKLNQQFVPAYNRAYKSNRYVEMNTDVYPELQTNKKEIADWSSTVPLTGDEIRELFGFAAMGTPEMQIPIVGSDRQPVSDFLSVVAPGAVPQNDGTYAA